MDPLIGFYLILFRTSIITTEHEIQKIYYNSIINNHNSLIFSSFISLTWSLISVKILLNLFPVVDGFSTSWLFIASVHVDVKVFSFLPLSYAG
jgi:hypothetical protein